MGASEVLWPTLQTLGGIFLGGAGLVLVVGRFNLSRILRGELGARYLGWLLLTPIYFVAIFVGGLAGFTIVASGIALALLEYVRAARLVRADTVLLGLMALLTLIIARWVPLLFGALPGMVLLLLTLIPILEENPADLGGRVRLISWGYLYVVWTLAHALLVWQLPYGVGILVTIIVGCALADIGAYCVGKALGRRPIAPAISPNKCWEGLLGDLLGAGLAVVLFRFALPPLGLPAMVGLVLLIGLGSAWGDLLSSLAKRNAGLKDWSSLIPGHGGILDRLNSLIVVLPLTYYYLALLLE